MAPTPDHGRASTRAHAASLRAMLATTQQLLLQVNRVRVQLQDLERLAHLLRQQLGEAEAPEEP
jgi:hypothetical protein